MTISGEPFTGIELDFTGKVTVDERAGFLSAFAAVLKEEYAEEIDGRPVQFYYETMSSLECRFISRETMEKFEIKLAVHRHIKKQKTQAGLFKKAS